MTMTMGRMLKKVLVGRHFGAEALRSRQPLSLMTASVFFAVSSAPLNKTILISPSSGALVGNGSVLKRNYGEEELNISVMRLADIVPGGGGDDGGDDEINQLFVHVTIRDSFRLHEINSRILRVPHRSFGLLWSRV